MTGSFDLIGEPWIPCLERDGARVELGLRETLLRAPGLRELAGESPLVTAALYRLLLAVLHRVYGPADEDAWLELWQARRWDPAPLDAYLERWRPRFDLFSGDYPFLQREDENVSVNSSSIAVLLPEVASGHNPTLFDHHIQGRQFGLTPAGAARALLLAANFGLSGTSGAWHRATKGRLFFSDAPCVRGALFFAEGDNLFETLCLNLTRYPWQEEAPEDRPAWEADDPSLPPRDHPLGRLDLLTWPNRNIVFLPKREHGEVIVRQVTVAPSLPLHPHVLDPMMCYRVDEKRGHLALRFTEQRALWRDATLLLGATQTSRPVLAVIWLRELVGQGYLPRERRVRFIALGMSKASRRATVNFTRAERLPLPLAYLAEPALVDVIRECVELAEKVSRQLWGASRTLASLLLAPQSDLGEGHKPAPEDLAALTGQWAVERHYWSRLELPFKELMVALPDDLEGGRLRWRDTLRACAWEALDAVCRSLETDLRHIKAVVRARDQLALGLSKALRTAGG